MGGALLQLKSCTGWEAGAGLGKDVLSVRPGGWAEASAGQWARVLMVGLATETHQGLSPGLSSLVILE